MRTPMLSRGLFVLGMIGLGVVAHVPLADAAPKEPPGRAGDDAAIEDAAKVRYAEGVRLYSKKRYEEARAAFVQATALKRRPSTLFMLAQSSLKSGRWLEAVKNFDAYLAEVRIGEAPPKLKEIVNDGRREARTHLGQLRFEVPEGAEVTLDGEKVASVETPIDVMPGPHAVVITHRDEKKTQTVEALPGTTVEVKPSFVPKALVPTSDTRTRPTPGPVRSTAPSTAAETQQESTILSPPATIWPLYLAGAVGLGGLTAAAIFGGLHANAQHAVDVASETLRRENQTIAACDQGLPAYEETCLTLRRNERFASAHQSTFSTTLIIGISATTVAVAWFFLAPKEKSDAPAAASRPDKPRVSPWVGQNAGGATLGGSF
jgi:hypothetical protein